MQPQQSPAAVLILLLPREAGVSMLDRCVASFCEVSQVEFLALVDTDPSPRTVVVPELPPRVTVRQSRCRLSDAATGLNAALDTARAHGCAFVLWGFSVETLIGVNSSTLCRSSLPAEWPQLDVLQLRSDATYMPQRDFFRADAFQFVGSGMPVPVPVPAAAIRRVAAWPAARLSIIVDDYALTPAEAAMIAAKLEEEAGAANAAASPRSAASAVRVSSSWATNAAADALDMLRLMHACQSGAWGAARQLGRERARDGSDGWGGAHGALVARMLQLEAEVNLKEDTTLEHEMHAVNLAAELGRLCAPRDRLENAIKEGRDSVNHVLRAALSAGVAAAMAKPQPPSWHPLRSDAVWSACGVLGFAALKQKEKGGYAPLWEGAEAKALLMAAAAEGDGRFHKRTRVLLAHAVGAGMQEVQDMPPDKLLPALATDWVLPAMAFFSRMWPGVATHWDGRAQPPAMVREAARTVALCALGLPGHCEQEDVSLFSVVPLGAAPGTHGQQFSQSRAAVMVLHGAPPPGYSLFVSAGGGCPVPLAAVGDCFASAAGAATPEGMQWTFASQDAPLQVVKGPHAAAFATFVLVIVNLTPRGKAARLAPFAAYSASQSSYTYDPLNAGFPRTPSNSTWYARPAYQPGPQNHHYFVEPYPYCYQKSSPPIYSSCDFDEVPREQPLQPLKMSSSNTK